MYDTEAFVILLIDLLLFGNWNSKASSIHILLIISQLHDQIRKKLHSSNRFDKKVVVATS